jgi:hypothetical protein
MGIISRRTEKLTIFGLAIIDSSFLLTLATAIIQGVDYLAKEMNRTGF